MKIGICGAPGSFETARQLGYDYYETSAASVAALSEEEFAAFLAAQTPAFHCEAANGLFPGDFRLTGPAADAPARLSAYLNGVFSRLAALGVKTVVLGSGGPRRCPEGFSADAALRQFAGVCRLAGEAAGPFGLTVGIEPLNSTETNLLTMYGETRTFAAGIAHPHVTVMADLYHMEKEGEAFSTLAAAPGPCHCHVAGRTRRVPEAAEGFLTEAAGVLRAAGYDGRVSLEAILDDFAAEAARALPVLRELFG